MPSERCESTLDDERRRTLDERGAMRLSMM
jgi:hypothetical protein